ncbi:MAG: hypothetical protein WAT92_12280 [Saprospiraceae bacterium]
MKINTEDLIEFEELQLEMKSYQKASHFLKSFDWCMEIKNGWIDRTYSLFDKLGIFLFEIIPINDEIDNFIWIIVGDLPSVYLDASIENAEEAIRTYCDLMEDWYTNVFEGTSIDECYPVNVPATKENAELLSQRIQFIRDKILD